MNCGATEEFKAHFCAFGLKEPTDQKKTATSLILLQPWDHSRCPNFLLFNTVSHQILVNFPPNVPPPFQPS